MDAWARKKEYRLIYRHGLETRQESTPPLDRETRTSKSNDAPGMVGGVVQYDLFGRTSRRLPRSLPSDQPLGPVAVLIFGNAASTFWGPT